MNPLFPHEIIDLAERGVAQCDEVLKLLTRERNKYEAIRNRLQSQIEYVKKYEQVDHRMYCEDVSDQLDKIAADARKIADKMYAYSGQPE